MTRLMGRPASVVAKCDCQRARVAGIAIAAIDLRPAVAVREQPQIDVVEGERQRHAQPADAARDLDDLGGRGRRGVGEFEDGG